MKIEVASIRPNSSDEPGPPFRGQSGGFSATTTARMLMAIAFGVQDSQLVGAPSWVESERFDITAKVEGVTGPLPGGMFPAALRALLETRFRLVARRETREGQIFALVAGPGRPKLQPTTGLRPLQVAEQTGFISGTMDLNTLANWLGFRLERTVVNRTGLSGAYDVELSWTPDADQRSNGSLRTPPPPPPPPPIPGGVESAPQLPRRAVPAPDAQGPSLFTAIQEQLGLKLEAQRGPVEVVVIDRIERPTPD